MNTIAFSCLFHKRENTDTILYYKGPEDTGLQAHIFKKTLICVVHLRKENTVFTKNENIK